MDDLRRVLALLEELRDLLNKADLADAKVSESRTWAARDVGDAVDHVRVALGLPHELQAALLRNRRVPIDPWA
jgi:hypothetical protein